MIFKYRAYISAEKRMVEVDVIDFKNKRIIHFDGFGVNSHDISATPIKYERYIDFDKIILMKSTGMYEYGDKNEIFEGDIIKTYFTADSDIPVIGEVCFNKGSFRLGEDGFELDAFDTIEILGNKFEHPKLLEMKSEKIT